MMLYSSGNSKLKIMSETLDTNGGAPQGKGLAIFGFVLSLVGLILSSWIAVITTAMIIAGGSAWLMYFWDVLCIASIVLSAMGMSKLGKTGGKKGLGIAGLIVGIVATVWAIILTMGLSVAAAGADEMNDRIKVELENL